MDLKDLLTPEDPAFLETVRDAYEGSSFLQETFSDPESVELFKWIASTGILDAPELFARYFPPVPPESLRWTSCGGPTEHSHLWTSIEDLERLHQLWDIYSEKPLAEIDGVLDFGVGCGRVLKWFAMHLDPARCHGVDVRKACTDWLTENYPGNYHHVAPQPPLPFPDDHFELVYSLSVFSHLNLQSNYAWFRELARVTKPGGRIVLSTHGSFALFLILHSREHQDTMHVPEERAREMLREFQRTNFAYHHIGDDAVKILEGPESDYGQAFFNEVFARDAWGSEAELIGHVPFIQNRFQDFFVLEPKK